MLLTKTIFGVFHRRGSVSFPGTRCRVEALLVGMALHPAEPLSECLRIAMVASRCDFGNPEQGSTLRRSIQLLIALPSLLSCMLRFPEKISVTMFAATGCCAAKNK